MIRIVLLLLLATSAYGQFTFQSIASYHTVNTVLVDQDSIWAGTMNGVLVFHKDGTLLKKITNVDGLMHNQVTSMFVDSKGDKWFGTDRGGISRLHGSQWESFSPLVAMGGGGAIGIQAIAEDKSGNMWFASNGNGGVTSFDGTSFTHHLQSNPIFGGASYSLAVDDSGIVWVGLINSVASFDGTTWTTYPLPNSSSIDDISIDSHGDKWFSYFNGISRLSGTNWTHYGKTYFQADDVSSTYIDAQDNLWIGTTVGFYSPVGKELIKFSIATQQVTARYTEPVGAIRQMLKVGNDLYMATGNFYNEGKLFRYDGTTWFTYGIDNSFGGYTTRAAVEDINGNMWFATEDAGVTKFDGVNYTVYNSSNSSLPNLVYTLASAPNGDIYAGTKTGVMIFHSGVWSMLFVTMEVFSLDLDSHGNVWVGSGGQGLSRYDGTWVTYNESNSDLISDQITDLEIDSHDNVWIGSAEKGISLFANGTFTSFTNDNSGLGDGSVIGITEDSDGTVWASIYGTGVYKYKDGQWTVAYTSENSPLPDNYVLSMCIDTAGRHWFGSSYFLGYVAVYNGVDWRVFTYDNSDLICWGTLSISADHLGNIWAGTFFGVSKLSGDPFGQPYQTITFGPVEDKILGSARFTPLATATSNLPITFSSTSDKISIAGNLVTPIKAGRTTIKANQPGNADYDPAVPVEQSFCILPAKPTVHVGDETAGTVLTSNSEAGNQWFLDGVALAGETNSTLTPASVGVYKVQVTVDDCIGEFSNDVVLIVTGAANLEHRRVSIYPNPAEDYLEVRGLKGDAAYPQLSDMIGHSHSLNFEKVDDETYRARVQHLSPGVYLLRLQEGDAITIFRLIKK